MMLLDTCAMLWLSFDEAKLSRSTLKRIDDGERILVCSLSFWEIGIKIKKKKLEIPLSLSEFVTCYNDNDGVEIIAPDAGIVVLAAELAWEHQDPVDRMIVATAKKFDAEIVTADEYIRRFYLKTTL
jgi:PIN domain nuclease of toxin-antitoxin system